MCRWNYNCDAAFRCKDQFGSLKCCWPYKNRDDCYVSEACFPSTAKLSLGNGKTVAMSELQVGDRIQTGMVNQRFAVLKSNLIKENSQNSEMFMILLEIILIL